MKHEFIFFFMFFFTFSSFSYSQISKEEKDQIIGKTFKDLELGTIDGKTRFLNSYKEKEKYMLLFFWSSGCSMCTSSVITLKEETNHFEDKIIIVGINLDFPESWLSCEENKLINWINLNGFTDENIWFYNPIAFPYYVLISPTSEIIATTNGYREGLVKDFLFRFIEN